MKIRQARFVSCLIFLVKTFVCLRIFVYLCDNMFNLNNFYMKKQLRNLALATAVAVAGSASAQTLGLTKVWEHDVASAGTPASGDARFGTGYGDKVYTVDKAAKTLIAWDANGASNVLTNDAFVGTCVTTDDAGNILISSAFAGAGAATGWSIISAADNSVTPLTITMPEDAPAARIDQVGRVVGNVLSEEGGYMYLWCSGNSTVAVIKIVNGVQDEASTYASIAIDAATTSCVAQPAWATVAEIDELADPSASFYFRNRSTQTVKGFNEDGSEVVSYTTPAADATNADLKARSCEGFDVFTLNGVTYCVHPYDDVNYGPGFAVTELATGNIIDVRTSDYNPGGQRYQSIVARVNEDGTASIFQYVSGSVAALYTFGPKAEPTPAAPLYAAGAFQGWVPESATEFTFENGVYVLDLDVTDTQREFKISTAKGTWDDFNAGVLGIAEGESYTTQYLTKDVPATLYAGGKDNIGLPWAGLWTITVDLTTNTIVATTETSNPGNPAELYVIGWVNGEQWSPSNGEVLEQIADGVYKNTNVFINGGPTTGTAYFSIAQALGTWDDVNAKTRYGASTNDEAIVMNTATAMTTNGNNAWTIETGNYSIEVNINNMTIIVSEATGIESIEVENADAPAVYYNLQGIEVENPAEGNIYIKVAGGKATKIVK